MQSADIDVGTEKVERDTEGDRERERRSSEAKAEILLGIHLWHLLAKAVGQSSHKKSPPTSIQSSPGCVTDVSLNHSV